MFGFKAMCRPLWVPVDDWSRKCFSEEAHGCSIKWPRRFLALSLVSLEGFEEKTSTRTLNASSCCGEQVWAYADFSNGSQFHSASDNTHPLFISPPTIVLSRVVCGLRLQQGTHAAFVMIKFKGNQLPVQGSHLVGSGELDSILAWNPHHSQSQEFTGICNGCLCHF